jgi:peroxiredoxin
MRDDLMAALGQKEMPAEEAYEAAYEFLERWRGNKGEYAQLYYSIEDALFASWSNAPTTWLLKGQAHIELAWQARGGGYANTVSKEGWKGFEEHLQTAEVALNRAWTLNPKDPTIAVKMMWVELGQGRGRDRMELWFRRAMDLDPDNYDACNTKLLYLEPKWHGSQEAMFAFAWECVESTNWGGRVPLILLDAHIEIPRYYLEPSEQTNYWRRPEVWPDIKEAFDKFFQLNPAATGWYHNYAWYAYLCEQWHALNQLIPKLGPVNYAYFGGKDQYDRIVRLAKEHADEPAPEIDSTAIEARRLRVKITAKMQEGKRTEADFAQELRAGDALLARHTDQTNAEMAELLFTIAQLYWQAFDNTEKGRQLVLRLKQDFPQTKLGRNADTILAALDKEEEVKKLQRALAVGTQFPEFDEKDLAGAPLSLANYRGKVVLIDFWATWCAPCVAELPGLMKAYEKYHDSGFEIVGISLDQDETKLKNFINQKHLTWQQYFDGKGWENKLAAKYGVTSIPATYLLDGTGKIIAHDVHGDSLEQAVAKALPGH